MPAPAATEAATSTDPVWTNSKAATVGTWVADASKGKPANGPGEFRQVAEASTKGTTRVLVFTDGTARSFGVATKLFVAQAKPAAKPAVDVTPHPKPSAKERAARVKAEGATVSARPAAKPVLEQIEQAAQAAATNRAERLALAKAEHATLQAWIKDGEKPPRPATPNLDAVNAEHAAGGQKPKAPKRERTITASDRTQTAHRAPGAFQLQVREYLRANPTAEGLSPGAIDKALAHGNSGQVGNALEALVKKGLATKVSQKPRRYSAVA